MQDQVQRVLLTAALESRRSMFGQSVASNNATIVVVEATLFDSVLHKKAKGDGIFLAKGHPMEKGIGKGGKMVRKGEKVARVELLVARGTAGGCWHCGGNHYMGECPRGGGIPIVGMVPT